MDEYVSKKDLIEAIPMLFPGKWQIVGKSVIEFIDSIPAANVRLVECGKWILYRDGTGLCSKCKRASAVMWPDDHLPNFCQYCGASMVED